MIAHLVTSTLLLLIAIAAARLLPMTARTRHALLLVGIAKFAIPAAAITAVIRYFRLDAIRVTVAPLPARILGGGDAPVKIATQINWLLIAWTSIAFLIFARWLLTRVRLVSAAMRVATPPSSREAAALESARRAVGVRTSIDLIRSPLCEAPAVLRVIRPVIVLPSAGCDELADDELLALLCHEVAHVKRRDNFLGLLEAAAGALLWFHPLVWLALHDLHVAREEACDEAVADATRTSDTYLTALSKICRALVAPRVAGVSCMANAKLKERITHLMRYDTLRASALSHRGVIAAAAIALLALTTGSALIAEVPQPTAANAYKVTFLFTFEGDQYVFNGQVVETTTGKLIAHPRITSKIGTWGESKSGTTDPDLDLRFRVTAGADHAGIVQFEASENGRVVQKATMAQAPAESSQGQYTGEPITLNLKDADIHDVLRTFGQITGMPIDVDPNVEGKVTLNIVDMPWDEAFDMIAKQNGLRVSIEGKKITIRK